MYWEIWHVHTTHAALKVFPAWRVRSKEFLISCEKAVLAVMTCSDMCAIGVPEMHPRSLTFETPTVAMPVALIRVCFLQGKSTCRTQSTQQRTM